MTTNTHTRPLMNLTHRVLAVIDDSAEARVAMTRLHEAGVPGERAAILTAEEGLHRIDARGQHGGRLLRIVRGLQSVNTEGEHLRRYEAELAQGRCVIDVPSHRADRDTVVAILRDHGAHAINAYGLWTIEQIAA